MAEKKTVTLGGFDGVDFTDPNGVSVKQIIDAHLRKQKKSQADDEKAFVAAAREALKRDPGLKARWKTFEKVKH